MRTIGTLAVAPLLLIAFAAACAQGQTLPVRRTFQINIALLHQANGSQKFELQVHRGVSDGTSKLISPKGVEYLQSQQVTPELFNSLPDLLESCVGNWTVVETYQDGRPPFQQTKSDSYSFAFNSFTLDSVWHEMPNILTPANGSVVPPVFDVIWNFPSGIVPGGSALRMTYSPGSFGTVETENDVVDPNSFRVTTHFPLGTPGKIKMTIGASHGQFSPIDFTAPTNLRRGTFAVRSSFITYAPPLAVTVVPEPPSVTLAAISTVVLAFAGRRFAAGERGR